MARITRNEGIIQSGGTINVGGAFAVGRGAVAQNTPTGNEETGRVLKIEPAVQLRRKPAEGGEFQKEKREWDVFICHSSEDKESFVAPLARELRERGLRVWYDDFTLRVGDSLRKSIDRGLAKSHYAVVVLSQSFFAKHWPQQELSGLITREEGGRRVVLPVWHHITLEEVRDSSPILADRVAARSSEGLEIVVEKLLSAMGQQG